MPRNVAALVDRLKQTKRTKQTFTAAEVERVLRAARRDRLEHAWRLALYGLRRGEVAGLMWSDINLKAGTLTVRENRVSVDGEAVSSDPKSAMSKRTLPLTPALVLALKRAKRRQSVERLKAGEGYQASGYLVVNEAGGALHPETVSDKWDELLSAAKVRRIRLHDARHTCGTLLHLEGEPIAKISAWLGHADPAFTMRTYVDPQRDELRGTAQALGSVTSL